MDQQFQPRLVSNTVPPGKLSGIFYIPVSNLPSQTNFNDLRAVARKGGVVDKCFVYPQRCEGWVRVRGHDNFLGMYNYLNELQHNGSTLSACNKNETESIQVWEPQKIPRTAHAPSTQFDGSMPQYPASGTANGSNNYECVAMPHAMASSSYHVYTAMPQYSGYGPAVPRYAPGAGCDQFDMSSRYGVYNVYPGAAQYEHAGNGPESVQLFNYHDSSGWTYCDQTYNQPMQPLLQAPVPQPRQIQQPQRSQQPPNGEDAFYSTHGSGSTDPVANTITSAANSNSNSINPPKDRSVYESTESVRKIVVKHLSRHASRHEIETYLYSKVGGPEMLEEDIRFPKEFDGKNRHHCFIIFKHHEDAARAIEKLRGALFRGLNLEARFSKEVVPARRVGAGTGGVHNGTSSSWDTNSQQQQQNLTHVAPQQQQEHRHHHQPPLVVDGSSSGSRRSTGHGRDSKGKGK